MAARQALQRGFDYLASLQRPEGCVVGEVVWCPIITAQYVLVAYLTGQSIAPERKAGFLQHLRAWQTAGGGWGLHAESPPYMFATALVYVALRLLGLDPDAPLCLRARSWLQAHGGVESIPSWGKLWLAMMRLYEYEGINPVLPELWLLPYGFPAHPGRLYCHTRLIYLGFCYLYGVRFRAPITPLIAALRWELYDRPYDRINFAAHRNSVAPADLYAPASRALRMAYRGAQVYERWRPAGMRRRALDRALSQVVAHQRQSNFAAISPVNGLLNVLVLYHAGHPDFPASYRGLDDWVWEDAASGARVSGAQSHTWDTAFAVQAICDGPAPAPAPAADQTDFAAFLRSASRYLQNAQIRDEAPHRPRTYRDPTRGGFCFGEARHRWPVSDCTGEALSAICLLHDRVPPEERAAPRMISEAVDFILTRQNADGGWASYERRRGALMLERLNTAEMFGACMVEHSYVECAASCMQGLRHVLGRFPHLLRPRARQAVAAALRRGVAFLRRQQQPDGSWAGFWGINYTYGTLFAIVGLLAGGLGRDDPTIRRAGRWLVAARLPDGGWGESWQSCVAGYYIPHARSQVIMTGWALLALLKAGYDGPGAREAIGSGVDLLLARQLPNGDWPQEGVAGVFSNTAMLHYCLYKNYFPLWALGVYAQHFPPSEH